MVSLVQSIQVLHYNKGTRIQGITEKRLLPVKFQILVWQCLIFTLTILFYTTHIRPSNDSSLSEKEGKKEGSKPRDPFTPCPNRDFRNCLSA